MKKIKKLFAGVVVVLLFIIQGCSYVPTIEDVENGTREGVEGLLMESADHGHTFRLDDYYLVEQIDDLTYRGGLQATEFYKRDSTKIYRSVIIKYQDKKYERCEITIRPIIFDFFDTFLDIAKKH